MKASQLPLFTLKEAHKEARVVSHQLLLRAGYIHKASSSGFYSYLPFGQMVYRNIEEIIRKEMNRFGAVEVRLPVMTHSDVWKESGRWSEMGPEMIRLKDRHENDYCLAPTHEEAITWLAKSYLRSYKQLPINFYQIGIKYRDETRPRFGLIRCREFTMKDAYSFHLTDDSLEETYQKMRECYHSIFKKIGIPTIPVQADSISMGGSYSEEFMVASEIGESTLLLSENQNSALYQANQDKTEFLPATPYPTYPFESTGPNSQSKSFSKVDAKPEVKFEAKLKNTPGLTSVGEVANFLKRSELFFIKALVYEDAGHIVIGFIPGDRDLSVSKLKNICQLPSLEMASSETIEKGIQSTVGFTGPYKLPVSHRDIVDITKNSSNKKKKVFIYFDRNLKNRSGLVAGGNQKDTHYINLQEGRDFTIHSESQNIDLVEAKAGDLCPLDPKQKLIEKKGIELGHIFKIGNKYTQAMGLSVLNKEGKEVIPTMGCYGIGLDRTLQTYIEHNHDQKGIIWSDTLSPYQIYYIGIFNQDEEKKQQEKVYEILVEKGFKVYFDDRKERAGVKFNDAELVGFPWQLVAGKEFLSSKKLELKNRKTMEKVIITLEDLPKALKF